MKKDTLRRLVRCLRPHRGRLALSFLLALSSVPLSLLAPVLLGRAIDFLLGPGQVNFSAVARQLLYAFAAICSAAALQWLMQLLTRRISAAAAQDLRAAAYGKLNAAPLASLTAHSQGDLTSRLVSDADAVAEGLLQALTQLLPGIVTILSTIAVMCLLNLWIALVVILVTPLSILFARYVGTRTGKYFQQQARAQGKVSGFAREMVRHRALVQAFGYEAASAEEFAALTDEYYHASFRATFYSSVINPGTRFVNAIVYAAVGVFGALSALSGGITVGGLSVFLSYANQYTRPFNEITAVLTQLQQALAGAARIFALLDWPAEPPDPPDALSPARSRGHVVVQNLHFSYHPQRPLLRDITFEAKPGQRIALVGPTGCGKTTLIQLLMRFYEADSGTILVDGTPITQIKRDALRGLYGMVLQETWLKQGTVAENIAYGRPAAPREEIIAAAKTALAHSFICRLPQGYDTMLQAGGNNLSAGQRQLLCIARIVLADPDILILDEATSSIDTRTELAVQGAMEGLMEGRTSFIVAHRLSTIRRADLILVMQNGKIAEEGSHEALLRLGGVYAELLRSQFAAE